MKFQTADMAAKRLNVTVRAVQKWAKEGKIEGAHKVGRDWLIPETAIRPDPSVVYNKTMLPEGALTPAFSTSYVPGTALEYVNGIHNEDDRNIALSEYYYFKGMLKECTVAAEPYLDSPDMYRRLSAALFCIFSNLGRGHLLKTDFAADIIKNDLEECMAGDYPVDVKAAAVFIAVIVKVQLQTPMEKVPLIEEHMRYLPSGIQATACYLAAHKAYLAEDYARAVGIAETALNCCKTYFPLPQIYLYIISAMAYINLLKLENAKQCIEAAWKLAEPDDFIMPFVEHYNLLQGLIESFFKRDHPEAFAKIIALTKEYNIGWYKVYNDKHETRSVAVNLTPVEFTVAMLYSRNWRAKEIAAHVRLSERTINNYIQIIYEKLHINGRKDLEKFMLK